jgi:peptidoglycan-associated lipoprotein
MRVRAFYLTVFVAIAGCSSKPPQPAKNAAALASEPPPAGPAVANNPDASNVAIAEDIRKACALSDSEAYFAYDSSTVRTNDRAVLKKLAVCFTSGPLKGRQMRLIGHADPRGDQDYNYLLGQRRADGVKSAIVEAGMSAASVQTTSRGENGATGVDESGWSKDRRVDVTLGT